MIDKIKKMVVSSLSPQKAEHTFCVADQANKIARFLGVSQEKVYIAALLHDITREFDKEYHIEFCKKHNINLSDEDLNSFGMLHAITGSIIAYNITGDRVISNAVRYHTTGYPEMTLEEKIVFYADYIEPTRKYESCIEERKNFFNSIEKGICAERALNEGVYNVLKNTVLHLCQKGVYIHPDTIKARNYYLLLLK